METNEKTITDKIINGLKNAITELEEFRVQAALGKAEAKDIYEDVKKKFKTSIHEAKVKFDSIKTEASYEALHIKNFFESLQVQLALGKAESKEIFEEQSKKIRQALHDLENSIRSNKQTSELYSTVLMDIEKFKIKMDILKLKYELKKMDVKDEFEEKKLEFLKQMSSLKDKMLLKEKKNPERWEHFQDEISEAYSHLKKAFSR